MYFTTPTTHPYFLNYRDMKKIFLLLILSGWFIQMAAQVNWKDSSSHFSDITWNNYSTSYIGDDNTNTALLITAIPYNGVYDFGNGGPERTPMDMTFNGSAYHFRSNLKTCQVLYTYDSSDVYFMAPEIFPTNANQFEFRVLEDDTIIIKPWSNITSFTDSTFRLNVFHPGFAFLGGYHTGWDQVLIFELRKKNQSSLISSTTVYWQQIRPVLLSVLTTHQLNEWLLHVKRPTETSYDAKALSDAGALEAAVRPDSNNNLSKPLILPSSEKELYFFIRGNVYRKDALEYQLAKNGDIIKPWSPNEIDNNYILLQNLSPGKYTLSVRYRKQRHNISNWHFEIKAAWFQTGLFKLVVGILTLLFIGSLVMIWRFSILRKRSLAKQARQERLMLGLKATYSQLNPHFIFNALSSIQGLINKNDINAANRYLSVFGNLVRSSLTSSDKAFIPLSHEINTLETYLVLEQLRFNFTWTIDTDKQLPGEEIEVPPLLLQPLVENAVKHGIASLHEKGTIHVSIEKKGIDLVIQISDNGSGFDPGQQITGYGLKLTKDRIQLLNELSADRNIIITINSNNGKGTNIDFLFKNWLA
jgi:two-component system LytT family sensor kinase